jgi:hypothetical protein
MSQYFVSVLVMCEGYFVTHYLSNMPTDKIQVFFKYAHRDEYKL